MPPISCDTFVDGLGDYVDGALAKERQSELEQHAAACPRCMEFMLQYTRVGPLVRKATDVPMPTDVQARLRRLVSRASRSRR